MSSSSKLLPYIYIQYFIVIAPCTQTILRCGSSSCRHIYVRICIYNYIYDMYAITIYERETRQAYSPEGAVCVGEGVEVERRARVARKRVSDNWYANNSAPAAAARAGYVCLSAGPHADLVLYSARDYRGTRAPPTPLTLRTLSTAACRRPRRHRRFRFCHSATIHTIHIIQHYCVHLC